MDEPPAPERQFESFYQATLSPLRRYLATLLGSRHDAQDIAHDAYLRTYRAMHAQPVDKPKAFLFTTARRLALNYRMRRAARMQPAEASAIEARAPLAPDPASLVIAQHERTALEEAILGLPPGCRNVLVLRNTEGLSHEEIAQRLGIARSSVEKHLARALRLLRERMQSGAPDKPKAAGGGKP